jgi:hypothetical protein
MLREYQEEILRLKAALDVSWAASTSGRGRGGGGSTQCWDGGEGTGIKSYIDG